MESVKIGEEERIILVHLSFPILAVGMSDICFFGELDTNSL